MTNIFKPLVATGSVAILLFTSLVGAAGAASAGDPSSALDAQLEEAVWSQNAAPTLEQAKNRLALSPETKEALLKSAKKEELTQADRTALKGSGLESLDTTGDRILVSEPVTTPAPVTAEALESLDNEMVKAGLAPSPELARAAQCWISRDEVTSWGVAGVKWGWKRQVDWCANGSVVTSFHRDIEEPGFISMWWHYRGADNAVSNGTGGWELRTYRRATIQNCPPAIGCVTTVYPFIEFTLRGNNTVSVKKGG